MIKYERKQSQTEQVTLEGDFQLIIVRYEYLLTFEFEY